jgi:branched-chain amino acid transport system permease protein
MRKYVKLIAMITPDGLAQTMLWGVANGCIYILLATGLNLIFGVMKLVNFAHGQLLMVGAFVAYEVTVFAGLNPYISILVSMAVVAFIGILLEKFAFRRVRGTEKLNEIFISLGLIYVFQNVATLFWSENYNIRIPSPIGGLSLSVGGIGIGYDRILAMVIVSIILVGLVLLTKKTKFGLAMRATSQKSDAAMLMGINISRVYLYTFALGAALAGAAGALYGILFPFNPAIGALPTIKGFAIIIIGGLGSIPGAVVGGLLYGIAENMAVYLLGGIWQDAIAFALLIIVLVIRPTGIFGQKGE